MGLESKKRLLGGCWYSSPGRGCTPCIKAEALPQSLLQTRDHLLHVIPSLPPYQSNQKYIKKEEAAWETLDTDVNSKVDNNQKEGEVGSLWRATRGLDVGKGGWQPKIQMTGQIAIWGAGQVIDS